MEAYAKEQSGGARIGTAAVSSTPTLAGVLNIVTDIGERAHHLASHAEDIANRLGGVAPSGDANAKSSRDPDNLTDALNDRVRAIHDPMHRIQSALERISQRLS